MSVSFSAPLMLLSNHNTATTYESSKQKILTSLDLIGHMDIKKAFTDTSNKKEILELNIAWCLQISDQVISNIVVTFPKLSKINISSCKRVTSRAFYELLCAPNISELAASHLPRVGRNKVAALSITAVTHVVGKNQNQTRISNVQNQTRTSNVRILHMDATPITDADLEHIINIAPKLEFISLRWCERLTAQGINNIMKIAPNLRCIDLTDLGLVQDIEVGIENQTGLVEIVCTKWY
jgi:hypothetical protein